MSKKPFSYTSDVAPENYLCSVCGWKNCKLWRQYQTFLNHIELMCVNCAKNDQEKFIAVNEDGTHEDGTFGTSSEIGWLVPAVPDEKNETFWGYTSIPQDGVTWWRRLPLYGDRVRIDA